MVSTTQHYSFTKLDPGDGVHAGTGAFPAGDRDLMDALFNALAKHKHTGGELEDPTPDDAVGVSLSTTGGTIPADTQVSYVWTIVDPETGETPASPVTEVTTAPAVVEPVAPTFTLQSIGGTLLPGTYFYVLTAYTGANTVETKATNPAEVVIPAGSSTNQVELTLPTLPAGVTGYNIYRRAPNEARYYHIGTSTTTGFIDAGVASSSRSIPSVNSTVSTNSVTITRPAVIDADQSWKIYRTYNSEWTISYLTTLASGVTTYVDTGVGAEQGSPPSTSGVTSNMTKITLTDGAHVQGTLPIANVDFVVDEDDMVSDSATKVPTQQSVKAYLTTTLTNKADLVGGVVPTAQMPSISIMNRVPVATQAARLALVNPTNIQVGDVAVQADTGVTWLLIDTDPSVAANWKAIDQSDAVQSVNGQTGTVVLAKTDVGLGNVDNTSDVNKPVSTAQQTALNAKVNTADYTAANIVGKFAGTPDGTKFLRDDGTLVTPAGSGSTAVARHLGGSGAVTVPAAAASWADVSSLINTGTPEFEYGTGFTLTAGTLANGITLPVGFYSVTAILYGTGGVANNRVDVRLSFNRSASSSSTVINMTPHIDASLLGNNGISTTTTYSIDTAGVDGILVAVRNHHATTTFDIEWLEVVIMKVA